MSGIRGLYKYLQDKGLLNSEPLPSLANARVAIDAHTWLATRFRVTEHLHVATGGLPLTLTLALRSDLQKFRYVTSSTPSPISFHHHGRSNHSTNSTLMKQN